MVKLLIIVLLVYMAVVALAAALQTRLLFPTFAVPRAGVLPAQMRRLEIAAASGERLRGVYLPASRDRADPVVALVFPGNGWNAEDAADLVHHLWPDVHVVAFHYRGYRPSEGAPSAQALLADAPLVLAETRRLVPRARVVAVGMSIGSGVAAHLAGRREVEGAVLVTPFDSLGALAAGHYRWLPVRAFLRHRMEPAADLLASPVPVAIIAAGDDRIVPARRTGTLRSAVPNLVYDVTIPGTGHNDLYRRHDYGAAMDEALSAVLGEPVSPLPR